jgi:phospholipid/cholesterol/gamma-HCH transport system substrate-binding protein
VRGIAAPLTKLVIFAVVTVLATTLLGVTIANMDLSSKNSYTARFSDVTSLNEGDDIRIAGVRVGQVEKISVADRRTADVKFSIDSGIKLPSSVTAQIKYRNIVGQRYIALDQGQGGSPRSTIPAGGSIPMDHTKPALDLTALFNGFKPLFQALSPSDVNKLSYEIIQVLQGEGGTIDTLLSHTASLTQTIASKDQVIGQVIDNLNSVLDTVNSRSNQLSDLVVQLQQLVSGLAEDRKPIGEAVSSIGDLTVTTSGLLEQSRGPLKQDIAGINALSKNLADSGDVIDGVLQRMPDKLNKISHTASYGSWFNFFLCEGSGTATVPPVINNPVQLTALPVTQPRCRR